MFKAITRKAPAGHRVVLPTPGGPADPRSAGATLVVYNSGGKAEKATVLLPGFDPVTGSGWYLVGIPSAPVAYRYRGTDPAGPIRRIIVKPDLILIKGGKANWTYSLAQPPQRSIAVQLKLGAQNPWCANAPARLSSPASFDTRARFFGQPKSPLPAPCPLIP